MPERLKTILKISLFVLVVTVVAFFLYVIFFAPVERPEEVVELPPPTAPSLPTAPERIGIVSPVEEAPGLLPIAGTIKIDLPPDISPVARGGKTYVAPLIESQVRHLTLSDGVQNVFFSPEEGRFYKISPDGSFELYSEEYFRGAQKVTWSQNATMAIVEFPDKAKLLYNFLLEKSLSLPVHWEEFDFSPSGESVSGKSLGIDPDNRWIITFGSDGSKVRKVESIGLNDKNIIVDWAPNEEIIAFERKSQDFNRQTISFIGFENENFKAITVEGRDFVHRWSPDGKRLLYSVYSSETNFNPTLWAVDAVGESIGGKRIRIPLETWADKCVIADNQTAYCGVPQSLPRGSGIIRSVASGTPDDLYFVNFETGDYSQIASFEGSYSITEPSITADKKYLLFVDEVTKKLHRIQLRS